MSPRSFGLTAGAVVILGGLVYLFLQATSDPAQSAVASAPPGVTSHPPPAIAPVQPPQVEQASTVPQAGSAQPPVRPPSIELANQLRSGVKIDSSGQRVDDDTGEPPADLDAAMDEANKAYDHGDYEASSKEALKVLGKTPENVRMLRIVVSSACMMGDADTAQKYVGSLPDHDQQDMARRCERAEITLKMTEKPKPLTPTSTGSGGLVRFGPKGKTQPE